MTECLQLSDVYSDEPDAYTCDLPSNIYTKVRMKLKRIDYIFHSEALAMQSRSIVMTGNIPGKAFPYSDHEGVEAVFKYNKDGNNTTSRKMDSK